MVLVINPDIGNDEATPDKLLFSIWRPQSSMVGLPLYQEGRSEAECVRGSCWTVLEDRGSR